MKEVVVIEGQTLYDIAVKSYGKVDYVFQLLANNPSLTLDSELVAGQIVLVDESKVEPEVFIPRKVVTPDPLIYNTTITEGQNIYDIALQEYGSIEGIWQLLADNSALLPSINEPLKAGYKLSINRDKTIRKDVSQYYRKSFRRVNTGEHQLFNSGIGYMGIEFTFIVG